MNVTIIGSGKMGRAIAYRLLPAGHHVTLVGHTPGKAEALVKELEGRASGGSLTVALPNTLPGEIVVLALPPSATLPVVHDFIELLPGKILIDITNPVNYQTMESTIPGGSAAEQIANAAPVNTRVVKAFNTTFAATLLEGVVNGIPLDVFMAGDDAQAKQTVARLIESMGLRPIDAGPLVRARLLEALGILHMAIQSTHNLGFKSAVKIIS